MSRDTVTGKRTFGTPDPEVVKTNSSNTCKMTLNFEIRTIEVDGFLHILKTAHIWVSVSGSCEIFHTVLFTRNHYVIMIEECFLGVGKPTNCIYSFYFKRANKVQALTTKKNEDEMLDVRPATLANANMPIIKWIIEKDVIQDCHMVKFTSFLIVSKALRGQKHIRQCCRVLMWGLDLEQ